MWLLLVNAYAQSAATPSATTDVYVKAVVLVITALSLFANFQAHARKKEDNKDVKQIEHRIQGLEQRFKEFEKSDREHREALARELGEASIALRAAIFDRRGSKSQSM